MSSVFSSPSAFNLKIRNLIYAAPVFLLIAVVAPSGKAQSCDNIPQGGGESILASATIDGTTTELTNGASSRPVRVSGWILSSLRAESVSGWRGTVKPVLAFVSRQAIPIRAPSITRT